MVKTTATATKKATEKKEKVIVPKHTQAVELRKNIIKSVEGKASSVRDENGKKINRLHTVKYLQGKKQIVTTMQIIYGRELLAHKEKNILELKNSKGSVYYFIPKK